MVESSRQQGGATDRTSEVRFGNVPSACEKLTLRASVWNATTLVCTTKIQTNKWRPPFGKDDWQQSAKLLQCGAWRDVHSTLLEVAKCKGIKKNKQKEGKLKMCGERLVEELLDCRVKPRRPRGRQLQTPPKYHDDTQRALKERNGCGKGKKKRGAPPF